MTKAMAVKQQGQATFKMISAKIVCVTNQEGQMDKQLGQDATRYEKVSNQGQAG